MKTRPHRTIAALADWRRRSYQVLTADVVASRIAGPAPPREWAPALRELTRLLRQPIPPPLWWTLETAYCGSVETQTDPSRYYFDGLHRPGPDDPPVAYFQLTLAGWGHFHLYGRQPLRMTPGRAFFAVVPSRHRYYLPKDSPGWTFAWIGIYHPYILARLGKLIRSTGPVLDVAPDGLLAGSLLRLLRGAIKKEFSDQFEAELTLFDFMLACERLGRRLAGGGDQGRHTLDVVRSRVLSALPTAIGVDALAASVGMSAKHFGARFRSQTGLTPGNFATQVRVHEATRLLLETTMPLKSIARACGFADANHFGKVFRRFQFMSPALYRRTMR